MISSQLVILRGNSGSGKTTIARQLFDYFHADAMLVSQDVVRREMLRVEDVAGNLAIQLIYDLCLYGNRAGKVVILEGILPGDKYGEMLEDLLAVFEGLTHVYYFDIPFDETLRRHVTKPNAHEFGEVEMRQWRRENDWLGAKGEQIIDEKMSQNDIFRMIIKDLAV